MQPPYIRRLAVLRSDRHCKDVGTSFVDPYFLFGGVAVDGNFPNLLSFPLTVKNHRYITLT